MSFRTQYEQKRIKPIRWNIVVYSILLSEAVTALVSLLLGEFMPELFIMGFVVPLLVAPGMMYYSYSLRAKLIEQLIQSEERVQASLAEKEVLLQELHHRVKNNMAVITGFLRLQSHCTGSQEAKGILLECQHRVRSMALVHEKLQLDNERVKVSLESYIKSLVDELLASCNVSTERVSCSLDIDDIPLDIKTTMTCGLIINELVTNSLKYAFEGVQSPLVQVGLKCEKKGLLLTVADNGRGIPEGLDIHESKTLGLQIVNGLVAQMQGTLNLDSSDGMAFHVRFSMPEDIRTG